MASMRHPLLVLSEQTCAMAKVEKHPEVALATVETEDKSVALKPFITYRSSDKRLSLSFRSVTSSTPLLVHCKMRCGWYINQNARMNAKGTIPDAEAHVTLLQSKQNNPDVLTVLRQKSTTKVLIYRKKPNLLPLENVEQPNRPNVADAPEDKELIEVPDFAFMETVTVTFMVYDAAATCPTTGLGLCLNKARLEGDFCDVKLVVGGEELAAHRTVLVARSPVLNKMLTGDFKEAREGRVELAVNDTPPAFLKTAMEKFLEYLYTDRILDWGGNEIVLLKLADMYMVPELRADCELELWSCGPTRALEVLHAVGLSDLISRKLRRRLTATVQFGIWVVRGTDLWNEFEKTYPFIVDTMFVNSPAGPPEDFMVDWSL